MPRIHTRQTTGTKAGKQNTPEADSASVSGVFFVCTDKAFLWNAQPASSGCSSKGLGDFPNKQFCAGPEGRKAKMASWYHEALLAIIIFQSEKED